MKPIFRKSLQSLAAISALSLSLTQTASAHCDAMDGPVITEAQRALATGDVTPLLKWVPATDEGEVRAVFDKAVRVRKLGSEAREFADRQFFATLVEVHRASEGAPFTGIKAAGHINPSVSAADAGLATGNVDELVARPPGKWSRASGSDLQPSLPPRPTPRTASRKVANTSAVTFSTCTTSKACTPPWPPRASMPRPTPTQRPKRTLTDGVGGAAIQRVAARRGGAHVERGTCAARPRRCARRRERCRATSRRRSCWPRVWVPMPRDSRAVPRRSVAGTRSSVPVDARTTCEVRGWARRP